MYSTAHPYSSLHPTHLARCPKRLTFLETGTNLGHGVQVAIDSGRFTRIESVEQTAGLAAAAQVRFGAIQMPRVTIHTGPSPQMLDAVLPTLPSAIIFLDAHGDGQNPLLAELERLITHRRRRDVLLIDDLRMIGTSAWAGITVAGLQEALHALCPRATVTLWDTVNGPYDLLAAIPPED